MSIQEQNSDVNDVLSASVTFLKNAFEAVEKQVEPPVLIRRGSFVFWRYKEQSIEAAIIQKLARVVSGLNSTLILLQHGMFQEVGALARMLDDYSDDVLFLTQALIEGEVTPLHAEFLRDFYQEEFQDADKPFDSAQARKIVPRKKIHAAISRITGFELNSSDAQQVSRTLHQAMSGYVHAPSSHIMDMYGGFPPHFRLMGQTGTDHEPQVQRQVCRQFHRAICTMGIVAIGFQNYSISTEVLEFRSHFEERTGLTEWAHPEELVARLKNPEA